MRDFAGNAIELHNKDGVKLLVLSSRADHALTEDQRERLSRLRGLSRLNSLRLSLAVGARAA